MTRCKQQHNQHQAMLLLALILMLFCSMTDFTAAKRNAIVDNNFVLMNNGTVEIGRNAASSSVAAGPPQVLAGDSSSSASSPQAALGSKRRKSRRQYASYLFGSDGSNQEEIFFAAPAHRADKRKRRMRATAVDCNECEKHGRCHGGSCICHKDPDNGFWAGENCNECQEGFAGPLCTIECAGGSCSACNGHGRCSMGITGDGTCECYNDGLRGHWDGADCNKCASKYFGVTCQLSCPGMSENDGQECYGRGQCQADFDGSGKCICDQGWGSETGCFDCDAAHYGFDCSGTCAGYVESLAKPCSGHGTCFNGTTGNGTCLCDPYFGTADCSRSCPNACSGRGECLDGADRSAVCNCSENWAPPDCSSCISSKTGANCHIDCKRNATTGRICSDAGICTYSGTDAVCECVDGYLGDICEIPCPGNPPCGGHGKCINNNGNLECQCYQDLQRGFWTGETCDRCIQNYNNSINCTAACPLHDNQICGGHGYCAQGKCYCVRDDPITSQDYCGPSCNLHSFNTGAVPCDICACLYCPDDNFFGEGCQATGGTPCPGLNIGTDQYLACAGHGYCDQGAAGTGRCSCMTGYSGSRCDLLCPTNPYNGLPCSGEGRGYCTWVDGLPEKSICKCYPEFGGVACELGCPMVAGKVCAGRGTCDPITAECTCTGPFTGRACNVPCACDQEHGNCNSTICYDYLSTQTCDTCVCNGNFTGLCNRCKPGHQGQYCEGSCLQGTTVGRTCDCFLNFSNPDCGHKCANDTNGVVCGGHGRCLWGSNNLGRCQCDQDWYGPACTEECTRAECLAQGLLNPQCNPDTGFCECLDDNSGRWAPGLSGRCDMCKTGFWGPACTEKCECSDHGSCEQSNGACQCYHSAENGHWTGTNCESCAAGYIGQNCERVEVQLTRIRRDVGLTPSGEPVGPNLFGIHTGNFGPNEEFFFGGYPLYVYDTSGVKSISYLNSTTDPNRGPGNIFGCANGTSTVVHVVSSVSNSYLVVQPETSCGEPLRVLRVTINPVTKDLAITGRILIPGINATVKAFSVTSQVDLGDLDVIPTQMIVMHVAQPKPDGTPFPGGKIVRLLIDEDKAASFTVPMNFEVNDIAIGPFYSSGQPQQIAVGGLTYGPNGRMWDVLMLVTQTNSDETDLLQFFLDALSIRPRAKCWPQAAEGTCSRVDCTCNLCEYNSKIQFTPGGDLLLVQVIDRGGVGTLEAMVALLEVIQEIPVGTTGILADIQGRCTAGTVYSHPIGRVVRDSFGREKLYELCDSYPCTTAYYSVKVSISALQGYIPTDKAFDAQANVLYVSIRDQVRNNKRTAIVKYSCNTSTFGIYGYYSDFQTPVEKMAINRHQRMLYTISKDLITPIDTFLLFEVSTLNPDIADLRGGTNITIKGSGYQPRGNDINKVVCAFADASSATGYIYVTAWAYSFHEILCTAPRQLIESTSGSSSASCEGQRLEVSIYGTHWFTNNKRSVKRVQRPTLNPIVVPDRGFKDNSQFVQVFGSGFVPSIFSRCKFYSNNARASEVLYSPVLYLSPTSVNCTQPVAQFASYDKSFVDVSLDGQLYSVDTPPIYQIVGDPTTITTTNPTFVQEADPIMNISIQAWIIDSQQHRLERLDSKERRITLYANISNTTCDPRDFAFRRPDDGFPWPPCRQIVLNTTYWFQLEAERLNGTNATSAPVSTEPASSLPPAGSSSSSQQPQPPSSPPASTADAPTGTSPPSPTPTGTGTTTNGTGAPASFRRYLLQADQGGYDSFNHRKFDNLELTAEQKNQLKFIKYTSKGEVTFDEFYFYEPRVASATITLIGEQNTWTTESIITITAGTPYALMIYNLDDFDEGKFFVSPQTPLRPIELIIVDRMANIVEDPQIVAQYQVSLSATYMEDKTFAEYPDNQATSGTPRRDAFRVTFDAIFLRSIHSRQYVLQFQSAGLLPVQTPPIRTINCGLREYKDNQETPAGSIVGVCRPCPPAGAQCNGTENITVLPGFWRSNGSATEIYECKGGVAVCPGSGSAPNGSSCVEGHTGPMCSLCAEGYGKSGATSCTKCPAEGETMTYVVLIAFAALVAVLGWIVVTLRKEEVTDVSIILRSVVNHMQAAGELGEFSSQWSPFLKTLFAIQGGASSFSVSGVQSLDCMLKQSDSDYTAVFFGYMALPPIAVCLGIIVFFIVRVLRLKPVITKKLREQLEEDRRTNPHSKAAIILEQYPVYFVIITSLCVTMFTLYQTLITQSTSVLLCKDVIVGYDESKKVDGFPEPIVAKYLELDMAYSCDTQEYKSLYNWGIVYTVGYGLGIPAMFIAGYMIVDRRIAKPELTKLMFTFLIGGYLDRYWWWQAIIMIRKMVLVSVIVFLREIPEMQSYCAVWTMSAALILQLWFNPNEKKEHNMVEALSLALITITLNLSLLYFWPSLPDTGKFFLTGFLVILTMGALLMFAYFLYQPVKDTIWEALTEVKTIVDDLRGQGKVAASEEDKKGKGKLSLRDLFAEDDDEDEDYVPPTVLGVGRSFNRGGGGVGSAFNFAQNKRHGGSGISTGDVEFAEIDHGMDTGEEPGGGGYGEQEMSTLNRMEEGSASGPGLANAYTPSRPMEGEARSPKMAEFLARRNENNTHATSPRAFNNDDDDDELMAVL